MKKLLLVLPLLTLPQACNKASFATNTEAATQAPAPQKLAPSPSISEKCQDGEKLNDMRISVLLDRSTSNNRFDCENRNQIDIVDDTPIYRCASTEKDRAIEALHSDLVAASDKIVGEKPSIHISIASYADDASIDLNWTPVTAATKSEVVRVAQNVSRTPFGWTRGEKGLEKIQSLYASEAPKGEDRMIVWITDGWQTPAKQGEIERQADILKEKYGVNSLSVIKIPNTFRDEKSGNPLSLTQLQELHETGIINAVKKSGQAFWEGGRAFFNNSSLSAFQNYFDENYNITRKVASSNNDYFELANKAGLTSKLIERIYDNATCLTQ